MTPTLPEPSAARARALIEDLPGSQIREVANAGMGRADVLPFWFGESDQATLAPVREAAVASLERGETFYSHNLGLPELRERYAAYVQSVHGTSLDAARVAITSSGVSALMIAVQALVDAGDEVVVVEPVWPNLPAMPRILGAQVRSVALEARAGRWQLDLDALLAALTPRTRLLMINSPNNPTGWTMPREQQRAVLAHCRATGTWIIADEVYHQLHFPAGQGAAAGPAPSFLEHAAADDRLVVAHSFSKSFWMTGWRLGALIAPPALMGALGKLLEFNTSCAPVFVQRGGLAALAHADALVDAVRRQLLAARPVLLDALTALPGAQVPQPDGAMYVFFRLVGHDDSLAVAKRLVLEAGLGVAPGSAFGAAGRGWLRWCYAGAPERMREGAARLARWLEAQRLRAAA